MGKESLSTSEGKCEKCSVKEKICLNKVQLRGEESRVK